MLLEVKDLKKHYPVRSGLFAKAKELVYALDGVSLTLEEGKTLGLVGESGCGKSTLGRAVLRLIEPTSGEVYLEGTEICKLNGDELKNSRKKMQIIFQDPFGSLNPRQSVRKIVSEPLDNYDVGKRKTREEIVVQLLTRVGLRPEHMSRYPQEFSGGQRQRIGIARALALRPKLIVCDEPVSSLDVSIQAQVLNLLKDLQEEYGLSYLFISHDLGVVRHMSDRIAVMYLGRFVELASAEELYESPLHPYSQALLSSIPASNSRVKKRRLVLEGDVPSPIHPPSGCRFHPRCSLYRKLQSPICIEEPPAFREIGASHWVSCHQIRG